MENMLDAVTVMAVLAELSSAIPVIPLRVNTEKMAIKAKILANLDLHTNIYLDLLFKRYTTGFRTRTVCVFFAKDTPILFL